MEITDSRRLGLLRPDEVANLAQERIPYLIDNFMLKPSINILAGHSGLCKSALCAQIDMCVASGKNFLTHPVIDPGPVIYCDAESTPAMMAPMTASLSNHLGLSKPPDNFFTWNPNWNIDNKNVIPQNKIQLYKMVRQIKPKLVVLDSLRNFYPQAIKGDGTDAATMIKEMRKHSGDTQCSWMIIHHLRKGDKEERANNSRPTVRYNIDVWMEEIVGAFALVNNTDLRLGWEQDRQQNLWLGGFLRVFGKVGPYLVERVLDEDGEPSGYILGSPMAQLTNQEQTLYGQLPDSDEFSFTYLTETLRKGKGTTSRFIRRCVDLDLIRISREVPRDGGGRPLKMYVKNLEDGDFVNKELGAN